MSKVGDFLWFLALKKGAVQAATALIALVGTEAFAGVDTTIVQKVILALVVGLINVGRNWLKVAKGVNGL
jgi:hypothetical protein